MTPPDRPAPNAWRTRCPATKDWCENEACRNDGRCRSPAQPAPDLDALFRDLSQCVRDCGGDDPDSMEVRNRGESAITSLRAQLAERDKRVSALEAALTTIREGHLGDCPAASDELSHAKSHIYWLRCLARDALKGDAT